jgi:hypothetical protein
MVVFRPAGCRSPGASCRRRRSSGSRRLMDHLRPGRQDLLEGRRVEAGQPGPAVGAGFVDGGEGVGPGEHAADGDEEDVDQGMATRPLDAWILDVAEVVMDCSRSIAGQGGALAGSEFEPCDAPAVRQRPSPELRQFPILMRRPYVMVPLHREPSCPHGRACLSQHLDPFLAAGTTGATICLRGGIDSILIHVGINRRRSIESDGVHRVDLGYHRSRADEEDLGPRFPTAAQRVG